MLRDEETARAALREFEALFFELVSEALRVYLEDHASRRYRYTPRTEASIIHDYMRAEARRLLSDNPRVRIIDRGNNFKLCIDGEWIVKLKKMGPGLRTANIPTQAVLSFVNQQVQLLLPGVAAEPTSLHLGYQKQEIELLSSPVFLVCPDGGSIEWSWAIAEPGEAAQPARLTPEAPSGRPRVSPRPATTTEAEQAPPDEEDSDRLENRDAEG